MIVTGTTLEGALPNVSLTHLVRRPRTGDQPHPPLLVLLHGVGSNEHDLFGLESALDPRFLVVSARAPLPMGPGAYGWYPVEFLPGGEFRIDPAAQEASRRLLAGFVDEVIAEHGADPARVHLLGFSQGAMMTLALALTHPEKVAGFAVMSGRLLPEVRQRARPREELARLEGFVVHGTLDPVVPVVHGRETHRALDELNVRHEYREYPMGHHVSEESLADVTAWLTRRLDAAA